MQNATLRLLALLLTLTMVLPLVACSQDTPTDETRNTELNTQSQSTETVQQSEENPMVRMYVPVLQIMSWVPTGYDRTFTAYYRYYYPSEWFREESFSVRVYREINDGGEQLYEEQTYGDHICTVLYYEDNLVTEYITLYGDDGEEIVSQGIAPSPSYLRSTSIDVYRTYTQYNFYDAQKRKVSTRCIWVSESGEPDEEIITYQIEETETGYISRPSGEDSFGYSTFEYDRKNRPIADEAYNYLYNEAGALIRKYSKCSDDDFTEIKYEVVEVPLSVARRFCMFKWEYID